MAIEPIERFSGAMSRADVLRIHGGLHDGAEAALVAGEHSVGDSFDDDIVLIGDGLNAGHVTLVIETGRLRSRRIVRANAPVEMDRHVLEAGEERQVRLPVSLRIGNASMTWEAGRRGSRRPVRRMAWLGAGAGVACLALIGAAAHSMMGSAPAARPDIMEAEAPEDALARFRAAVREHESRHGASKDEARATTSPATADRQASQAVDPETLHVPRIDEEFETAALRRSQNAAPVETARVEVARRLEEEGVRGVDLVASDDTLVATGVVEPRFQPAWQMTQRWFDERFAGAVQLVNQVRFRSATRSRPPTIEAVWLGDPAYVVVGNEKHMEGAAIRGGWTVEAIRPSGVIFARNETLEKVTVKF